MNQTYCFSAWRILILTLSLGLTAHAQLPAFPGAEGFGKFATGGRGGTVYHVTNLNDSGAGSFRTGATTPNCTVVFDVAGVIRINSLINVAHNVTIAGQTAPGGGVTIYGNRVSYSGSSQSITRFLRVRMGINGDGNDAMGIANGHDMIFDHVSNSWGQDENFSVSGDIPNITIQNTIIAQGLRDHSAGGLIQSPGGVSILRCFYIDNNIRNPKVKFTNEFVNNIVYNWGEQGYILGGDSSGTSMANVFNNYFISGPDTAGSAFTGGNLNFNLFATNNWFDSNRNGVLDGAVISQGGYGTVSWQTSPFSYPTTNALPTLTALKLAVSDVGSSWSRDTVDEQLLTELTSWGALGELIRSEYDSPMNGPGPVRSAPAYSDFDQDGLPDFWEAALGLPTNAANNNVVSPSGYTQLEDYLNWMAAAHGIALTNTTVEVDLHQFTRGFLNSSPVYSLMNSTNGTVTLRNGHLARFVPDNNFIGPAGFQWTVVDADGSTLTRPMNLFFTPSAQTVVPVWRGDGLTNNWNTAGDPNWFDQQSLLYPFHTGDNVTFDDTGSTNPAVNLIGSLQPSLVTVNAAQNYTFSGSGSLAGAMALTKTGTGTLTLNTTNQFSGGTMVSNGTLLVHGSLSQSAVTVRSGATLGGNGRLGVSPTLNSGAVLAPGNGIGGAGTLTISNGLTEAGGVINRFDLSNDPTGLTKTNDQIIVVGTLTVSGKNTIRVSLPDGPLLNGTYTLFKFSNFVGSLTNFTLINANGVLTNLPGEIAIYVNNPRTPEELKWAGGVAGNTWDDGTTTNWLHGVTPEAFHFFDTVLFADTGLTNPPVNLVGSLTPASVTINATKNYTIGGSGKITGYSPLIKTNSGTLTLLATNDYVEPTVLAGGVLSVPWLANAGLPSPIGAADSSPDNLIFTGGTLRFTGGNGSTDRGATLAVAGGTIEVSSGATTLTWSGDLTGSGLLTKTGAGKLSMSTAKTYSGGTQVTEGAIILNNDAGLGTGTLTLNGGSNGATLQFGINGGAINNPLNVVGPNNFTVNNVNNVVSDMIGSGTLTLSTGTTFSFQGNLSAFNGTIKVGTVTNPRFNGSIGSSSTVFDLGNTSALLNTRNGATYIYLGALIGGPNTALKGASSADKVTTYVIGGRDLDTTFAGKIWEVNTARAAAITKVGTGTFTLTGANAYTGGTIVDGGTLLANNTTGSATATNSVTVNDTGTLGGTGFIASAVFVNSGGALSPGSNGVGTLTLRSNLTLKAGSSVNFEVGTSSDTVAVAKALVLNGTVNVTGVAGFGAGTYTVMTYGGALSGTLPVIGSKPSGYSVTVNTNTAGQVRLVVQVQTPPVIGNVGVANGNFVMIGTGPTNQTYQVLASTNLALPLVSWTSVQTNQFSATGTFAFTNAINPAVPQSFYRLQLP